MNLRVDLILDTERRSGSVVSAKGVLRIISVVVPVIFLIFVAWQILLLAQLKQDLNGSKLSLDSLKPQQEKAKALIAEFQVHRDISGELSGWTNALVDWREHLQSLIAIVPENIQLQDFTVANTLQLSAEEKPTRRYGITIRGKATGADAEPSVRRLEAAFKEHPTFSGITSNVVVSAFGADTSPTAKRDDRVFQIGLEYQERVFK